MNILDWPALSPDMSPIEHLWDALDKAIRQRPRQPGNLQELTNAIIQEWRNIPINCVRRLIGSMRRRCLAMVNAAGGHTRY